MARGQAKAAGNQLKQTNAIGAEERGQANALEAGLIPKYESMMNEGFSPEGLNAMRTSGMGAEAAAADTAGWAAGNRAARTGNAAGIGAEESQLARDKGVSMGKTAADIEAATNFKKQSNKRFALEGEQGLFGTNTQAMESLYGMSPGLLQARAAGKSGDELGQGWVNSMFGHGTSG